MERQSRCEDQSRPLAPAVHHTEMNLQIAQVYLESILRERLVANACG